jgi:hypothetical protein
MNDMRKLIAIALVAVILNSCKDKVDDRVLVATGLPMDGTQQVPTKQVAGNGTIDAYYNRNLHTLYYTVKWNSLTGNPIAGFGLYGPAAKKFKGTLLQSFSGFPAAQAGTYSGTVFIDGVVLKEEELLLGEYYISIPTAANPTTPVAGGEIRGQIEGLKSP